MALLAPREESSKTGITAASNATTPALSEVLQTSGLYEDSTLPVRTAGQIPSDIPYNRYIDGKLYTFMTGQAYRNLCAEKNIEIPNFRSRDDEALYGYLATMFGINVSQSAELCQGWSTENAMFINKKLNNPKLTGCQPIGGNGEIFDDTKLYCRLPFAVNGRLASAGIHPDNTGGIRPGIEGFARVGLAV